MTTVPASRRARYDHLLTLKRRIDNELRAIEDTIHGEIEANRRARALAEATGYTTPRRPAALCGTPGGYTRHRRTLHEDACQARLLAHRVYEANRARRRRQANTA